MPELTPEEKAHLRDQAHEMVEELGDAVRAELEGNPELAEWHGRRVDKLVARNTHELDQAKARARDRGDG